MHKLRNVGVAESRSRKAGVHNEGFGLRHSRLLWSPVGVLMVSV